MQPAVIARSKITYAVMLPLVGCRQSQQHLHARHTDQHINVMVITMPNPITIAGSTISFIIYSLLVPKSFLLNARILSDGENTWTLLATRFAKNSIAATSRIFFFFKKIMALIQIAAYHLMYVRAIIRIYRYVVYPEASVQGRNLRNRVYA